MTVFLNLVVTDQSINPVEISNQKILICDCVPPDVTSRRQPSLAKNNIVKAEIHYYKLFMHVIAKGLTHKKYF